MPFSHHSHSGQFCSHAADSLEAVIQAAIDKKMTSFCLTEHMPRHLADLYPEEVSAGHTEESLAKTFDDYYQEARRLQKHFASQIAIFIGFEAEWIRPESQPLITELLARYDFDLFIGSVHHMHTIPIDYDTDMYHEARAKSQGKRDDDAALFADYFDAQYDMLEALRPPLVGHLDLIRLKSDDPERSFRTWPEVWRRLQRNLRFIASYGGVLELNSSSLRKGMSEAYPQSEICTEFRRLGGRFTLSDDSHGVAQVGLNYAKVLTTLERAGITELYCLTAAVEGDHAHDPRFPGVIWRQIKTDQLQASPFFQT